MSARSSAADAAGYRFGSSITSDHYCNFASMILHFPMKPYSDDQNGHNRWRRRFRASRKWNKIPVRVLREFGQRMLDHYTQRGLAAMLKISPTAVSDFVLGKTEPERRTRKAFARLYLAFHPEGYVEEREAPKRRVLPQLKAVLPDSEEEALELIEGLIAAGKEKGLFKDSPEPLRDWLMTVIEAEYAVERRYRKYERKRRRKGSETTDP